jgi:hypothetical protein
MIAKASDRILDLLAANEYADFQEIVKELIEQVPGIDDIDNGSDIAAECLNQLIRDNKIRIVPTTVNRRSEVCFTDIV